jgi:hypothetical protein
VTNDDDDISRDEYEELVRRQAVGETADFDNAIIKEVGDDLFVMPSRITALPDDPTAPYDIRLEIRAEDGHHVVEQLVLTRRRPAGEPPGPPVTSTGLTSVHVAALVRETVAKWTLAWDLTSNKSRPPPFFSRPQRRRRGPTRSINDSQLSDVARIYRDGKASHRGIEAVSESFVVSRSTAHRAIRRAVKADLLAADEIGPGGGTT